MLYLINILIRKVPIHEISVILKVTKKSSDFHFCKKENPFGCATVQFDLIFLNSAWFKNALNTPEVICGFCRIKSLKLLDLKALKFSAKNNFPKLSHATLNKTLWVQIAKQFRKFDRFTYKN